MATVLNKATEGVALKPLMPILEKVKSKDLHGAISLVFDMPMLNVLAKIDMEMPRTVIKTALLDPSVQMAIQNRLERMPEQLRPPITCLQAFLYEFS